MKKDIIKYMACATMALGLVANVQGAAMGTMTGSVTISGTAFANGADFNSSTAFTSFTGVTVSSGASGTFVGLIGGTAVAMTPFTYGAGGVGTVIAMPGLIWITTPAGSLYDLSLTSATIEARTQNSMTIDGIGMFHVSPDLNGNTWTDTAGYWYFTTTGSAGTFGFSASDNTQLPNVPDGGTTALLLGGAISMLALIRRKLA